MRFFFLLTFVKITFRYALFIPKHPFKVRESKFEPLVIGENFRTSAEPVFNAQIGRNYDGSERFQPFFWREECLDHPPLRELAQASAVWGAELFAQDKSKERREVLEKARGESFRMSVPSIWVFSDATRVGSRRFDEDVPLIGGFEDFRTTARTFTRFRREKKARDRGRLAEEAERAAFSREKDDSSRSSSKTGSRTATPAGGGTKKSSSLAEQMQSWNADEVAQQEAGSFRRHSTELYKILIERRVASKKLARNVMQEVKYYRENLVRHAGPKVDPAVFLPPKQARPKDGDEDHARPSGSSDEDLSSDVYSESELQMLTPWRVDTSRRGALKKVPAILLVRDLDATLVELKKASAVESDDARSDVSERSETDPSKDRGRELARDIVDLYDRMKKQSADHFYDVGKRMLEKRPDLPEFEQLTTKQKFLDVYLHFGLDKKLLDWNAQTAEFYLLEDLHTNLSIQDVTDAFGWRALLRSETEQELTQLKRKQEVWQKVAHKAFAKLYGGEEGPDSSTTSSGEGGEASLAAKKAKKARLGVLSKLFHAWHMLIRSWICAYERGEAWTTYEKPFEMLEERTEKGVGLMVMRMTEKEEISPPISPSGGARLAISEDGMARGGQRSGSPARTKSWVTVAEVE